MKKHLAQKTQDCQKKTSPHSSWTVILSLWGCDFILVEMHMPFKIAPRMLTFLEKHAGDPESTGICNVEKICNLWVMYTSIAARGGGGSFKREKIYNSEEQVPIEFVRVTCFNNAHFEEPFFFNMCGSQNCTSANHPKHSRMADWDRKAHGIAMCLPVPIRHPSFYFLDLNTVCKDM